MIRDTLLRHLRGGEAFMPVEKVVAKIDFTKAGLRVDGLPYSAYELLFHIRFAQKDILDFCSALHYATPAWPEAYWPAKQAPDDRDEWAELIDAYRSEREGIARLADDPDKLTRVVKNGDSQTLIRELLLVIEHTAYHTGQLMVLARLLSD